ncbi:MAG: hypothetical protein Q9190_008159, partial [Brigantiaea leucoxantha]
FVAGGLASTVRQWVLEVGEATTTKKQFENEKELLIRVAEVSREQAGRFILVRAEEGGGRGKRWILVGSRDGDGDLKPGTSVRIGRPNWEIEIEGETWSVGVQWERR